MVEIIVLFFLLILFAAVRGNTSCLELIGKLILWSLLILSVAWLMTEPILALLVLGILVVIIVAPKSDKTNSEYIQNAEEKIEVAPQTEFRKQIQDRVYKDEIVTVVPAHELDVARRIAIDDFERIKSAILNSASQRNIKVKDLSTTISGKIRCSQIENWLNIYEHRHSKAYKNRSIMCYAMVITIINKPLYEAYIQTLKDLAKEENMYVRPVVHDELTKTWDIPTKSYGNLIGGSGVYHTYIEYSIQI